jgi:pimeloyl-ACP methyl ester carboxylesterase
MNVFLHIIVLMLIIIIVSYLYLNWFKYAMLFVPIQEHKNVEMNLVSPQHMSHCKDVYIPTTDGSVLHGWHYKAPSKKNNNTVLLCHGNTGNISYRDFLIEICALYHINVVMFDYRGYGKSTGYPSQETIYQDGQSVYDWMVKNGIDASDIVIWGESLGGTVATYLASVNVCKSLVLLATFASLPDIVWSKLSFVEKMILFYIFIYIDPMESKRRIRSVKCPIVVVHSPDDGFIDIENAQINIDNISHSDKHFMKIQGTHTSPKMTAGQIKDLMTIMCCRDMTITSGHNVLDNVLVELSKPQDYANIFNCYNKQYSFITKPLGQMPPLI